MPLRYLVITALFVAAALGPALLRSGDSPAAPGPEAPPVPGEALKAMQQGRYWRASRVLQGYLASVPEPEPETLLLAAQADAGWGNWAGVERLLAGQRWLDSLASGYGWNLLGQSQYALGQWEQSGQSLSRYLALSPNAGDRERGLAEVRRGRALSAADQTAGALAAFETAKGLVPQIGDWIAIFAAEASARAGDTARVRAYLDEADPTLAREWGWSLRVRALMNANDLAGAEQAASAAANELQDASRRADAWRTLGDLRLMRSDQEGARTAFRRAMAARETSPAALDAARKLSDLPGLTPEEQLRIGRLYLRHGNIDRGIAGLNAYLAAGRGSGVERAEIRLEIGRALFRQAKYADVERRMLALAEESPSSRIGAEAMYLAGRAQYRQGRATDGRATFRRTADHFPNESAAAEALFLVADLNHDDGRLDVAREFYRRTIATRPSISQAGLAAMRLGGIAFAEGDYEGAAAVFEEYRRHHPNGRRYQQATYWAARAYERLGRSDLARTRMREVHRQDPISWYGFRAAEELGLEFWDAPLEPSPPANPRVEAEVAAALVRLDLLRELDLGQAANFETERLKAHLFQTDGAMYALAEAFNARGYTMTGIRMGWEIHSREGAWNPRLLRIIYPFPYQKLIMAEAAELGIDPFLVAGLIRQESMFIAEIKSPAGAIGLMQIMPATGRALAQTVGMGSFDLGHLEQPEINIHLGVTYVRELLGQYGDRLTSVLAAYNAGPHRVSRWSQFPEYEYEELFAERIPFSETRDYVKIVQRNARIYAALYSEDGQGVGD